MGIFQSILSRIGISHSPPSQPTSLKSSAIRKLPLELILHIIRFLPPESAASFSLCCRSMLSMLGRQHLVALKDGVEPTFYNFLTLLERDLSSHILCYYCKKLHAIKNAHRHIYSNRSPEGCRNYMACWEAEFEALTFIYLHQNFSLVVFQMMMKLYRQGLDYSKLLNLLSYNTRTRFREGYVEQRALSARIVAGSLLVREQLVFMVPKEQPLAIPWDLCLSICPHFYCISPSAFDLNTRSFRITFWDLPREYYIGGGIRHCNYCLTEFCIDFKQYGEQGNALFVTKWQNLGQGRSPLDQEWKSHFGGGKGQSWLTIKLEGGSICAMFEGIEHHKFKFEGILTSENKMDLFKKSPYEWPAHLLHSTG